MSAPTCTCLAAHDTALLHYVTCDVPLPAGVDAMPVDNTDMRCLAELAAYRDIDVALYVLRTNRSKVAHMSDVR